MFSRPRAACEHQRYGLMLQKNELHFFREVRRQFLQTSRISALVGVDAQEQMQLAWLSCHNTQIYKNVLKKK